MQRNEISDSDTSSTQNSNVPNFNPYSEAPTVWPALESDQAPHEEEPSIETPTTNSSLTEENVGRIERMSFAERISKYFESLPEEPYARVTLTSEESDETSFDFKYIESPGFTESSFIINPLVNGINYGDRYSSYDYKGRKTEEIAAHAFGELQER